MRSVQSAKAPSSFRIDLYEPAATTIAAALSTTRRGAQNSLPKRCEVELP